MWSPIMILKSLTVDQVDHAFQYIWYCFHFLLELEAWDGIKKTLFIKITLLKFESTLGPGFVNTLLHDLNMFL